MLPLHYSTEVRKALCYLYIMGTRESYLHGLRLILSELLQEKKLFKNLSSEILNLMKRLPKIMNHFEKNKETLVTS